MSDKELLELRSMLKELSWGQVYNSTISGSRWLLDTSVSPGRWAVGYEFLYVLYRVLNDVKPISILELGLGQSTKLTGQYAKSEGIQHLVIEHDMEWVNYFFAGLDILSRNTVVQILDLEEKQCNGEKFFAYKDFSKCIGKSKYQLISVDGPFGGDGRMSRRDILGLLPDILEEDFVILYDDCGRIGERTTVEDTIRCLTKAGLSISYGLYDGGSYKQTAVIASSKWKWLTTL